MILKMEAEVNGVRYTNRFSIPGNDKPYRQAQAIVDFEGEWLRQLRKVAGEPDEGTLTKTVMEQ